ncbi:MAG: UDP-N-acetylmuramoyl-tripeptide--D-alanyl-D-alanine ligase [Sedimentisphaerales bacterium]|nr:UDP-N-acetylmuramoyl-tripeptide--D-alanyl-D-alanine ligase [Sedimentisphaerales bacterium]
MKSLTVGALARIVGSERFKDVDARFTGVSTDSRTVRPGDCFFAIAGEQFDGHDYVGRALAQGAACAVVSGDADEGEAAGKPVLKVPDTVAALGDLAREYRHVNSFQVVAITGSVGKTTTRQIVFHVLSQKFRARQARKNFNNTIGLPLTLLDAEPEDEIIVAELGANRPGEIAYLTRIARPEVAVVTNVYPAHLEGFGTLETIVREKVSIAEGLSDEGLLIVNADIEPLAEAARKTGKPLRTFGTSAEADYRVENVTLAGFSSTFTIRGREMHLPLPGPGNVANALAAWAVCDRLGVTLDEFAAALESLSGVAMRTEPVQIAALTIISDCYNASPASMNNALAVLVSLRGAPKSAGGRRLVFICGEMAELGPQTESLHAELGKAVARAGVDLLLTVGKPPQTTARLARETARHELRTRCFDDTPAICDNLEALIEKDDIILVKGSRTARLERVVDRLHELFAGAAGPHRMQELPTSPARRRPDNIRDRETG